MKILIVSGFLGAGKTTFIKRLARNVDQRFAILENEYGAAGIDGARLGQNRQGTQKNVWEMTEQCICCIGKKDFAASVLTIANVAYHLWSGGRGLSGTGERFSKGRADSDYYGRGD